MIDFPLNNLNLQKFIDKNSNEKNYLFDLISIANHDGLTPKSGFLYI